MVQQDSQEKLFFFIAALLLASAIFFLSPTHPTAFVTNEDHNVTINVSAIVSINVTDTDINFGNCTVDLAQGYSEFDSAVSNVTGDNADCVGIYNGSSDYLEVENDGNVNVYLNVSTNIVAADLFTQNGVTPTSSMMAFRAVNSGLGCDWATITASYENMTTTGDYVVCENFTYADSTDSIQVYAWIHVDAMANEGGVATWTFTGTGH